MVGKQLNCLIVGETPATQFLSWRLSLGNSFLILVSQYVPSDGLVGWKSSRLGANFYTPNIFTKDVKELSTRLTNEPNGTCKYSIDIMLIAGISIDSLKASCQELSKFVEKETCILISADFGCELEKTALSAFGRKCKCVLSIACDVECRQLSLGSYALVNDDNCRIFLGVTYSSKNHDNDSTLLENELKAQVELDDKGSNLNQMLQQLTATPWIKVEKFSDSQRMAVKMWEFIIPKISLNILSIIYEQFDYDLMLQDKNIETMFKDLVRELFEICMAQCNSTVDEYSVVIERGNETINFRNIIEHCKRKKLELINSTSHEYPEYLSLPFEPYCFYHRFEYPAQILLYQPIVLAKKYNVACSNLNFLYGFYSRLLSLSGLSIKGGRVERSMTQFDQLLSSSSESVNEDPNGQSKSNKNKKNEPNSIDLRFSMSLPAGASKEFPNDMETQYVNGSDRQPKGNTLNSFEKSTGETESFTDDEKSDTKDSLSTPKGPIFNMSHERLRLMKNNRKRNDPKTNHASQDYNECPATAQSIVDDMAIVTAPQLDKRNSQSSSDLPYAAVLSDHYYVNGQNDFSNSLSRPYTTSALELQLRNGHNLIVKEYHDLQNKLFYLENSASKELCDERRLKYAYMEKQLWKFQRRLNVYNGKIPRPTTGPYEDLLDHIDILTHNNPIDILRCTTGRYSEVDLYTSIQADKEQIIKLFERRSKSVTNLEKQRRQDELNRHTISASSSKKKIGPADLYKPNSSC